MARAARKQKRAGRPKTLPDGMQRARPCNLFVNLYPHEKRAYANAASRQNLSLSEWARLILGAAARAELRDDSVGLVGAQFVRTVKTVQRS
jgi:hypothetical protein